MSSESSTPVDVSPAAEILRALTPPALATLLAFREREQKTQADIAAEVGVARSTISKYVQTLLELPVPVLNKDGHRVTVTPDGRRVIEMYRAALEERSIDVETVDWDSPNAQRVEDALSPLYRFRSASPYLILDGIYELDRQVDASEQIWEDDLLLELDGRDPSTVESISNQHFNQVLDKFDSHDVIDRDGDSLSLTDKGRTHGHLCRELQLTFGQQSEDRNTAPSPGPSPSSEGIDIGGQTHSFSDEMIEETPTATRSVIQSLTGTDSLGAPDRANAFRGGLDGQESRPTPKLGPVICVQHGDDVQPVGPVNGDSASDVARTLRALAMKLEELNEATDEPLRAGVCRSLVRGDHTTPLGNDWQTLSEASFTEWHMINKALELVSNES